MNSPDPFKLNKPTDRDNRKRHSVAGQRHSKHATRHPHTILGAIAPDAAPIGDHDTPSQPARPAAPPLKPVAEILTTALPPEESYNEAALVASSAFKPRYTVPHDPLNPVIYGSSTMDASGNATPAPVPDHYDISPNGTPVAAPVKKSSNTTAVIIIVSVFFVLLIAAVIVVVVLVSNNK